MKILKSIFYLVWLAVTVACQRKPAGLEIGINHLQQLYGEGFIEELVYTKDDWVIVELEEEVLQKADYRKGFEKMDCESSNLQTTNGPVSLKRNRYGLTGGLP